MQVVDVGCLQPKVMQHPLRGVRTRDEKPRRQRAWLWSCRKEGDARSVEDAAAEADEDCGVVGKIVKLTMVSGSVYGLNLQPRTMGMRRTGRESRRD